MKKVTLSIAVLASTALMVACGGGEQKPAEEAAAAQEESVVEEAPVVEMASGEVNVEESQVMWKGEMLGVYDHSGNISIKSGSIEVTDNMISGGNIVIDMTSMVPTDENYSVEHPKEDLVGHLSSDDFFAVETYPEASFTITGHEGEVVMGDLTIRDKTNPVKVENVAFDAESSTYKGTLTVNRRDFDVVWDSPIKENVLSDEIELTIYLKV